MSSQSVRFKIVPRPDWVRRRVAGSKYDGAIDAALKLKDDRKVVYVPSGDMKFNNVSIALRNRIANRKLSKKIHVEQSKQTKQIAIVKGCSFLKETGRRRPKGKRNQTKGTSKQSTPP
ncbi:hypothetical protein MUP05_01515 [Candidatus Bathyarchaeota archaeon]|jgi:hypothetical protein|nr:hypothetical protein [Candidatus Bathyarchaeota archaeon]